MNENDRYGNVIQRLEDLETGRAEHRENIFTDDQIKRIKEIIHDEVDIRIGRQASQLVILAVGAVVTTAVGAVIAYLGVTR